MQFTKMHGLGNDFIVVDAINQRFDDINLNQLAMDICNRNFGIGADGLILVLKSDKSDFKMRIFNADGSEPEMCGNGVRCFSKFVYDNKLIEKDIFSVETLAGIMVPALIIKDGFIEAIEVDMGKPILETNRIPVANINKEKVINEPIKVADQVFHFTGVSMGNPHAVVFVDDLQALDIDQIGPLFENHEYFPERVNTEFVQIINKNEIALIVWERGAGRTLACGTGASASVVAGILNGFLNPRVIVHLPGGNLIIEWQNDEELIMTGPAETVFKGEIDY
ncbi:MAG: diaminopimelate epimerase [Candidatus Margulisiibacteriota bacterium]